MSISYHRTTIWTIRPNFICSIKNIHSISKVVEGAGDFSIPTNQLRGYEMVPAKFTMPVGPAVATGFRDEHPTRVPGPLPRNADGIPTKI